MRLIAGLGNPGLFYRAHRHNVGFMVIDCVADRHDAKVRVREFNAQIGNVMIGEEKVVLAKPWGYMNNSGDAVAPLAGFLKLKGENLIVVHDDLDLPLGRIKVKRKGGDGGHKGVRSIIERIGTDDFVRIRVGIGKPAEDREREVTDYVLTSFGSEERKLMPSVLEAAADAVEFVAANGSQAGMNRFNGMQLKPED